MENILIGDFGALIQGVGLAGLFAIIFAESGLFVGFFFPGDSLLFAAGFLASQGVFNIFIVIAVSFCAAVLGDSFGYAFGRRIGPKIFIKEESLFFRREYVDRAKKFYEKHGKKAVVLARFVPFVRTFAPIFAGVGMMHYRTFLLYNVMGGILWAIGLPFLGYYLGNLVPDVDRYLLPLIIFIVVISSAPALLRVLREKELRAGVLSLFKKAPKRNG